jgi:hypothetical protein
MTAFSFPGEFGTDVRPPAPPAALRKLWAQNESSPGAGDGTRVDAGLINSIVANLRALASAAGTPADYNNDNVVTLAVQTLIAASVSGEHYTKAEVDADFVLQTRTLTGAGLVGTIGDLSANRTIDVPIASQAEAEAGTNNTKGMTPLRVAQAIAALAGGGGGSGVTAAELAGALYGNVDVASAGTCDILGAASICVTITGTTTITSLGTGADRWRIVRFSGALTLTHNATSLILPTGANIVTAANDCMIVRSDDSSNVRVVSYMRANGEPLALTSGQVTTALGFTPVTNARTLTAAGLLTGGGDLTNNRTFDLALASQGEAEAGTNNTKAVTPLRVAQAIAVLALASFNTRTGAVTLLSADVTGALGFTPVTNARTVSAAGLLTGGGDLTTNRTLTATAASQAEAEAGTNTTTVMTPQRASQAIAALAPVRSVQNFDGGGLASTAVTSVALSIESGGVLRLTYRKAS